MTLTLSPPGTFGKYCFQVEPEEIRTSFGAWLRARLRQQEMSPADLARELGIQNGTVSRWINDERRPSSESAHRIADALFIDRDVVLDAARLRTATEPSDPDDPVERVCRKLRRARLDPLWLQAVEAQIDVFLEHRRAERRAARGQS